MVRKLRFGAFVACVLLLAGIILIATPVKIAPVLTSGVCTNLTFTSVPDHVQKDQAGTISVSSTGCTAPLYRFWLTKAGSVSQIVQDYSSSNSYTLNGSAFDIGEYLLKVWTKDSTSGSSFDQAKTYDNPIVVSEIPVACDPSNPSSCYFSHNGPYGFILAPQVHVHLIFWGSAWANQWVDPANNYDGNANPYGFGSVKAKTYLESLFIALGNHIWMNIAGRRYCMTQWPNTDLPQNSTVCPADGLFVGNAGNGWCAPTFSSACTNSVVEYSIIDTHSDPPVQGGVGPDQLGAEARYVEDNITGPMINGVYLILLPTANGGGGCTAMHGSYPRDPQYHSAYPISWAVVYYYNSNVACPRVNNLNIDSLGHGNYDWYGISALHEFIEAATDPDVQAAVNGNGWFTNDTGSYEIGDYCQGHLYNTWLAKTSFLVDPQYYATQEVGTNDAGCTNW